MVDLGPDWERLAKLARSVGSPLAGERRAALAALEIAMRNARVDWSDIGNAIERGGERDESKYTESELQEYGQALRAEGIEAGIKIGMARASNGRGNGRLTLPRPAEMAEYCRERPHRLKDDAQREFIDEMYAKTQRGINLQLGTLGYLASIYIRLGGRA